MGSFKQYGKTKLPGRVNTHFCTTHVIISLKIGGVYLCSNINSGWTVSVHFYTACISACAKQFTTTLGLTLTVKVDVLSNTRSFTAEYSITRAFSAHGRIHRHGSFFITSRTAYVIRRIVFDHISCIQYSHLHAWPYFVSHVDT